MKISKFIFLASLVIFSVELPILKTFFGQIPSFSGQKVSVGSVSYLFAVGILILSFFTKNKTARRFLENCSLVLSAVFYRLLVGEDLLENIPLIFQFLFLISFGLFLYFKIMTYLDKDLKQEE